VKNPEIDSSFLGQLLRYFRVTTGFLRSGNSARQISRVVPLQPWAVQCSRPW
jgi:hypothetical protein